LPFGTRLRVRNLSNGRTVVVRINDRGPRVPGRVLDLSLAAARALEMLAQGIAEVECEILP
jgi:rare lipoprotein A